MTDDEASANSEKSQAVVGQNNLMGSMQVDSFCLGSDCEH
jgi:hypothetical protein